MTQRLDFAGEVIAITGAGGGLGRAYALELASRGAKLVINDLGDSADPEAPAHRVVREISGQGGTAVASFDSVAAREGGRAIIETALNAFGRIDGVVANAGVLRDKSFGKLDFDDAELVFDVHLRGTLHVVQPAFVAMRDSGRGGRLLLTTSASGLFGNFGQASYAAAKSGIVGLTRTIAIEGAKAGIAANAIAPVAGTRLTTGHDIEGRDAMAPARVAPMAAALLHRSCPSSGETFLATGGWYARCFVGLAEGWSVGLDDVDAETLLAHWERIRDPREFSEPTSANHIGDYMQKHLYARA